MSEVEGTVQGHRDGHGFVIRDDRQADLYLSQQEMRAVLHRDRVKARIVRFDRKGRPEGRVLEIIERKKSPIIGRLLHESGVWLVAPEDKRYGQDILIPKNAVANHMMYCWLKSITAWWVSSISAKLPRLALGVLM
jgi:ribonuclease R